MLKSLSGYFAAVASPDKGAPAPSASAEASPPAPPAAAILDHTLSSPASAFTGANTVAPAATLLNGANGGEGYASESGDEQVEPAAGPSSPRKRQKRPRSATGTRSSQKPARTAPESKKPRRSPRAPAPKRRLEASPTESEEDDDEEIDQLDEDSDLAYESQTQAGEGDSEDDAEEEDESAFFDLANKDIDELKDPRTSRSFNRFRNDPARGPIGVGDVVQMRAQGGDAWFAVVESIRSKTSALTSQLASSFIGLETSWLYNQKDLLQLKKGLKQKTSPWDACKDMGPNERVKTQHCDWNHQSKVLSTDPELVYVFDDCYPARSMNAATSAAHPLDFFSHSALLLIAPSRTAGPALVPKTNSERDHRKTSAFERRHLPPYFFGVSALPPDPEKDDTDARRASPPKAGKLARGRDGVAGIPYVRVGFSFEPSKKPPEDPASGSEAESEPETGKGKGKGKGKLVRKGKPQKKQREKKKVWPIQFAPHSLSDRTYNPRRVQRFSRAAQWWYDVEELLANGHHGPVSSAPPPSTPFSLALDAVTFDATAASTATVLKKLQDLAADKIVRGGAFGLTGNAYLVTRAGELVSRLVASEGGLRFDYEGEDLERGREMLAQAVKWREEVGRRKRGVGEGRGLGKEWKLDGDEMLPQGHEWLAPESEEREAI